MTTPDAESRDIIVIAGSAGALGPLLDLVRALPPDLTATLFVVLHMPPTADSKLPEILTRAGPVPALRAVDGQRFEPGHIYVGAADHHLLVETDTVRLTRGPRENRQRPSADPLFRSAAHAHGARVIGVILSGALDDGTAGLAIVRKHGGIAIVQDPDTALFAGMPASALDHAGADHCVPATKMAELLVRLTQEPIQVREAMKKTNQLDRADGHEFPARPPTGDPSGYACPECHGVLWEVSEADMTRYRCRIGHAYSTDSLLAAQADGIENALGMALRTLEESAGLSDRLARQARQRKHDSVVSRYEDRAQEARRGAVAIRRALAEGGIMETTSSSIDAEEARA